MLCVRPRFAYDTALGMRPSHAYRVTELLYGCLHVLRPEVPLVRMWALLFAVIALCDS